MARRLRLQYPGAIYHVMSRGNGRQDIIRDDDDRDRLQQELGRAAVRCGWKVYAFVILSNPGRENQGQTELIVFSGEPGSDRGEPGSDRVNSFFRKRRTGSD
jgi:hypothetical protein